MDSDSSVPQDSAHSTLANTPQNQPASPQHVVRRKSKSKLVLLLLATFFLLLSLGFAGMWYKTKQDDKQIISNNALQLQIINANLSTTKTELDTTTAKLDKAQIVPALSDFSPQCGTKTNDNNLLITPVTPTPIDGYQLFLIDCKQDLAKGNSVARLTGFKVKDGNFIFAYGASSLEPFCISKSILGADAADQLVAATGLATCRRS